MKSTDRHPPITQDDDAFEDGSRIGSCHRVAQPTQRRPFITPIYDPQGTNKNIPRIYCSTSIASLQPDFPYPGEDNFIVKARERILASITKTILLTIRRTISPWRW